jgi:hypothetical protein
MTHAGHKRSTTPTALRPWGDDPVATSVKPIRNYREIFPDDDDG